MHPWPLNSQAGYNSYCIILLLAHIFGASLSRVVELNWWSCELSQCQVCCWNLQPLLVSFLGPILGVGRAWRAWSLSKSPKHTINIYQYNHTYEYLSMSTNVYQYINLCRVHCRLCRIGRRPTCHEGVTLIPRLVGFLDVGPSAWS